MDEIRIYSLAWDHVMFLWHRAKLDFELHPDNQILKYRVARYWVEQEQIHARLLELYRIEEETKEYCRMCDEFDIEHHSSICEE